MRVSPLAGRPAPPELRTDPARVEREYHARRPDVDDPGQLVSFGTSGHRGSPLRGTFTEAHVLAIAQAVCDYRRAQGVDGPVFVGKDTHAASGPAERTKVEVLTVNGVTAVVQAGGGYTPTPAISRAILAHNRGGTDHLTGGIVLTQSHNRPADGGFKYNPPNGGPADTAATRWIEERANDYLLRDNAGVRRATPAPRAEDFAAGYVADLRNAIDPGAIRRAGVKIGAAPLGGAAAEYWVRITDEYGLDVEVVGPGADPAFAAVPVDHDGQVRMDCSSPYAMAGLVGLKDRFAVDVATDPDADRHGVVTPTAGLMNPNHFLAVAIDYLLAHRPGWPAGAAVGKTLVSSGLIDRVVAARGRKLCEVPVGFNWFARGLFDGTLSFGGEESAGASFLRSDRTVGTTDKEGILLALLAAEITAVTGKDPGEHYRRLAAELGTPCYVRLDAPATPEQKARLRRLSTADVRETALGGDPVTAVLTRAPGNDEPVGGLKVVTAAGWFATRPSGTDDVYKLYAKRSRGPGHPAAVVEEARWAVAAALGGAAA